MEQARATNNNIASMLRVNLDLQGTITQFIKSMADTRDKRYQEEIDGLEDQMKVLERMLEEKKTAKEDNRNTNEKIQDALAEEKKALDEQRKKKSIDWYAVRNTAINVAVATVTGSLIIYIASKSPAIGQLIKDILAP